MNENLGRSDVVCQLLVFSFEQLDDSPDGNVLESNVGGSQESDEVGVKTSVGFIPDVVEWGIVLGRYQMLAILRSVASEGRTHPLRTGYQVLQHCCLALRRLAS